MTIKINTRNSTIANPTGVLQLGAVTNQLVVDSASGNIGIGTSTITSGPSWTPKLVVSSSSLTAVVIKSQNTQEANIAVHDGFYIDVTGNTTGTNNNIIFRNTSTNSSHSPTERMRIDSLGNVAIGYTSTSNRLHLHTAGSSTTSLQITNNTDATPTSGDGMVLQQVGAETFLLNQDASNLKLGTSGTTRLTIDSSGNVGIGITPSSPLTVKSPVAGGTYITVVPNTTSSGMVFRNSANSSDALQIISSDSLTTIGSNINVPVVLQTNGTEKMRIDTTGKVGIGCTPVEKLEVANAGTCRIFLNDTTNSVTAQLGSYSGGVLVGSSTNHAVIFRTNDLERMRIDTSGYVGIGTTSSIVSLHLKDAANPTNTKLVVERSVLGYTAEYASSHCGSTTASDFIFNTNNTERMRITSAGNVGIGNPGSSQKLLVRADSSDTSFADQLNPATSSGVMISNESSTTGSFTSLTLVPRNTSAVQQYVSIIAQSTSSGYAPDIVFAQSNTATTNVERMRIDSSGNVGIGISPQRKLHLHDSVATLVALQITNASTGSTASDGILLYNNGANATLSNEEAGYLRFITSAAERMRIDSSGNIAIGTTPTGSRLHIHQGADGDSIVYVTGLDLTTEDFRIGIASGVTTLTSGHAGAGNNALAFATASSGVETERLRISSDGYFDLNTGSIINYTESYSAPGTVTGTVSPNAATNSVYRYVMGGNLTISPTGATSGRVCNLSLILQQDATGNRTVTTWTNVRWGSGAPPVLSTAANAVDIITLFTHDGGSNWYGFLAGKGMA